MAKVVKQRGIGKPDYSIGQTDATKMRVITAITGSVSVTNIVSGSIDIKRMPAIVGTLIIKSGSIDIRSLPSITGSVGIKELPSITGSVDIRAGTIDIMGSVGIKELPAVSGSVGIKELPSITGSVDIRGGTVNITGSVGITEMAGITGTVIIAGGTVHTTGSVSVTAGSMTIVRRLYFGTPLFDGQHIAAGSTLTSVWVDVGDYRIKTVGIKQSATGSVIIDVAQVGTTDPNEYYTDAVVAGTFESKSFTEAFNYVRVKAYMTGTPSAVKGTVDVSLSTQA